MVFSKNSPYYNTPVGSRFIGNYVHREIPSDDSDYELEVENKYNERPKSLSNDLFGTPKLFWVFIAMNRDLMTDPVYGLKSQMTITVPTRERILALLG